MGAPPASITKCMPLLVDEKQHTCTKRERDGPPDGLKDGVQARGAEMMMDRKNADAPSSDPDTTPIASGGPHLPHKQTPPASSQAIEPASQDIPAPACVLTPSSPSPPPSLSPTPSEVQPEAPTTPSPLPTSHSPSNLTCTIDTTKNDPNAHAHAPPASQSTNDTTTTTTLSIADIVLKPRTRTPSHTHPPTQSPNSNYDYDYDYAGAGWIPYPTTLDPTDALNPLNHFAPVLGRGLGRARARGGGGEEGIQRGPGRLGLADPEMVFYILNTPGLFGGEDGEACEEYWKAEGDGGGDGDGDEERCLSLRGDLVRDEEK